jgi:hypothetical protein
VDGGAEQQEVGGARGEAGRRRFGARRVGARRGAARRRRRGRGEWRVERTEASRGAVAPLFFPHFEIDTHFLFNGKRLEKEGVCCLGVLNKDEKGDDTCFS